MSERQRMGQGWGGWERRGEWKTLPGLIDITEYKSPQHPEHLPPRPSHPGPEAMEGVLESNKCLGERGRHQPFPVPASTRPRGVG